MTKNNKTKNSKQMKKKNANKKPKQKRINGRVTGASSGPVSMVSTAPVAIGNSVRGATSISRRTPTGVIVNGRDFMFTPVGTGSITTWVMVGGTPITPVAFGDSVVRQYLQMYQKYRWRAVAVHYITSSPTSSTGDVMFYHGKNRDSVFLNQTSSFLLPFVISDPDTVLGPQWTNHSAAMHVQGTWKSTDYGMTDDPNDYSDGEVFLMSKTTTTDSPGYVLFDYEIEFAEMQISPRLLTLPIPRAQYNNVNFGRTSFTSTQGNVAYLTISNQNGYAGSVTAWPTGTAAGDIFKVIIDATNSTIPTNSFQLTVGNVANQIAITDGFTCYAVYQASSSGTTGITLYLNAPQAYSQSNPLQWGSGSGAITDYLQTMVSYVGSVNYTVNNVSNF